MLVLWTKIICPLEQNRSQATLTPTKNDLEPDPRAKQICPHPQYQTLSGKITSQHKPFQHLAKSLRRGGANIIHLRKSHWTADHSTPHGEGADENCDYKGGRRHGICRTVYLTGHVQVCNYDNGIEIECNWHDENNISDTIEPKPKIGRGQGILYDGIFNELGSLKTRVEEALE